MLIVDWNSTTTTTPQPATTTTLEPFNITVENVTSMLENMKTVLPEHTTKFNTFTFIVITVLSGALSVITVIGNFMVMISFKIDKQLQTISNYFLFSLAVADFAVGLISMPLFTVYTLLGYWPLGPRICDTWLALDYLASNASVLNLLIISFDRYFSVTRPLTYRAKRTTNRAIFMIGCAWGISLLLWPPWIYAWPHIEGERTVPLTECYIQFIETNHYITFGTAIAAFYVPVTVMCFLYWRIWRETEKRQKDLPNLQAGKKDTSKRSNSSDEQVQVQQTETGWSRARSQSNPTTDHEVDTSVDVGDANNYQTKMKPRIFTWSWIREWCVAWWHSGHEEEVDDFEDTPSDMGYGTPVSVETPLQSSVSRCVSMNMIRDPYASVQTPPTRMYHGSHHLHCDSRSLPPSSALASRSISNDSVYTILIKFPPCTDNSADEPTIRMMPDETMIGAFRPKARTLLENEPYSHSPGLNRRPSQFHDGRIPWRNNQKLQQADIKKNSAGPKIVPKKKKKPQEKKADKKAAKTLSAILLTFIITWTPYSILVLLKPLTACLDCIPQHLWDFFYYLCYINSTINPMCYALCNASFRRTYVRILTCKWHSRNRVPVSRGAFT